MDSGLCGGCTTACFLRSSSRSLWISGVLMHPILPVTLGVLPVQSYETATVPLAPGDRIVIYSNGVTEAAAPDGEEFTSERLLDLLVQRSGTSTDEFADYTLRQLIGWTRKPRLALDDDLTLLVIDVPDNGNSAHQTR